jgi:DNA-binding NarL/FixJ family response regulator
MPIHAQTLPRTPIRVAIVDACPVMRAGLIATIAAESSMEIVATAAERHEILPRLRTASVDVLVMNLVGLDGAPVAFLRTIKQVHPRVGIVVLAPTVEVAPELLAAGVSAYLAYTEPEAQLCLAIRAAKARQRFLPPLTQAYVERCDSLLAAHRLVARELQILRCLAQGMRIREIAAYLDLCEDTIQNYMARIRNKTGWSSRTQMVSAYISMYGSGGVAKWPQMQL